MHHPRRKNGSKKVPNVKLRPVGPVVPEQRPDAGDEGAEFDPDRDGGAEHDDMQVDVAAGMFPFRGVTICPTGNVNKVELARCIEELGGSFSKDLTDAVQYLVADAPGTSKYTYALSIGLPIMAPQWVFDAHDRYVHRAEDFTLEDTLEGYQLPYFSDLRICVSGENHLEQRHAMARLMHQQGATYMKDLNEDVTHLLICGDASDIKDEEIRTAKLIWALDQNRAREKTRVIRKLNTDRGRPVTDPEPLPNIHILWVEWFWDSLNTTGRYPESDYVVEKPRPERKKPPRVALSSTPSFALATTSTQKNQGIDVDESTDGMFDMEIEPILKRTSGPNKGAGDLWKKMASGRISNGPQTVPSAKPSLKGKEKAADEHPQDDNDKSYLRHLQKVLPAPVVEVNDPSSSSRPTRAFGRVTSSNRTGPESASTARLQPQPPETGHPPGLFSGKSFVVLAELNGERDDKLKQIISSCGGEVITSWADSDDVLRSVDFVAVRLQSAHQYGAGTSPHRDKMRTECWVEHCIWAETIVPGTAHVTFMPLTAPLPIPGIDEIEIAVSGLDTAEALYMQRFCTAISLRKTTGFKKADSTHLVCPSKTGQKYDQALAWGKPVVGLEWVYALGCAPTTKEKNPPPMVDVTNDSPPEDNVAADQVINLKRPYSAVADTDSLEVKPAEPSKKRIRDRTSIVRVEKTPSINLGAADSDVKGKPKPTAASVISPRPITPVASDAGHRGPERSSATKNAGSSRSRSKSAIPSSQSPSPLKSPAADHVRKQLAAILEADSEDPPSDTDSPNQLPPIRTRTAPATTSKGSTARKKARPKPAPRFKTIAGEIGRTGSMSSVSSTEGRKLKGFASLGAEPGGRSEFSQASRPDNDDSMRVLYDDPHQRAAKRQLMDLVTPEDEKGHPIPVPGSTSPKPVKGTAVAPRRSTRTAGF